MKKTISAPGTQAAGYEAGRNVFIRLHEYETNSSRRFFMEAAKSISGINRSVQPIFESKMLPFFGKLREAADLGEKLDDKEEILLNSELTKITREIGRALPGLSESEIDGYQAIFSSGKDSAGKTIPPKMAGTVVTYQFNHLTNNMFNEFNNEMQRLGDADAAKRMEGAIADAIAYFSRLKGIDAKNLEGAKDFLAAMEFGDFIRPEKKD